MKKLLTVIFCLLIFSGCSYPNNKLTVVIGVNPNNEPFEYLTSNNLEGFSIDVIKTLIEKAGYYLEWQIESDEQLFAKTSISHIDLSISKLTEELSDDFLISTPYFINDDFSLVLFSSKTNKELLKQINKELELFLNTDEYKSLLKKWEISWFRNYSNLK